MPEQTIKKGQRPGFWMGVGVGLLVIAPIVALFFLADVVFGLPLVPLDVIDWSARNLPGNLLTAGIDAIVATNDTLNLGRTDVVAKTIEQLMGIASVVIAAMVGGGVLYLVLRRVNNRARNLPLGALAGVVLGLPLALMSGATNFTATTPPALNFVYIVLMFVAWGVAVAWIYNDLTTIHSKSGDVIAAQLNRRQFLVRVGGVAATLTVVGGGLSALLGGRESIPLPASSGDKAAANPTPTPAPARTPNPNSAASRVERSPFIDDLVPAQGTRPEYTPISEHYRIDIAARPPIIEEEEWVLPISGMVDNPLTLTLEDLRTKYEARDQIVTMSCISNLVGGDLISTTRWTGVSLQTLLEEAQISPSARALLIKGADGFDEYVDLALIKQDERIMLTYAWDGQPLAEKHGFPLRIWIPDRYGMKQPKWIISIEAVDTVGEGYWVRRGWSFDALVNTTSVIDTISVDEVYEQDGQTFVPLGGIAYAGARSIARVEVRMDDGEWVEAQLKTPLSDTSWVVWRYDWPFEAGPHAFEVRAIDGVGVPQVEARRDVRPDGATGIHRMGARL
jgi:DMSO/TMAO reductase YedYZ molybdopterin-dependent catalytic subunit